MAYFHMYAEIASGFSRIYFKLANYLIGRLFAIKILDVSVILLSDAFAILASFVLIVALSLNFKNEEYR